MTKVGVIIPTYGDIEKWEPLVRRAVESVNSQTVKPENCVWRHDDSLMAARNSALESVDTEWVVMLDADDELDTHYIEAMIEGEGDIRQPSTLGIVDGVPDDAPVLIPRKNLLQGNFVVIGAMCRTQDVLSVGGFRDFPILEDWELWIRMVLSGKKIVPNPSAIYKIHVLSDSRNNQGSDVHGSVYSQIRSEYAGREAELE